MSAALDGVQKGRNGTDRSASWVQPSAGECPSPNHGGATMRNSSTRLRRENFLAPKNFTPKIDEVQAAKEFSAVILDFSAGQLAYATGRSKQTAKCWKAGRAFPNGNSLKSLEAEFPAIRSWANNRWGIHDSAERLTNGFALLEQMMASNSPEGRAMRARFQQMLAEKGGA